MTELDKAIEAFQATNFENFTWSKEESNGYQIYTFNFFGWKAELEFDDRTATLYTPTNSVIACDKLNIWVGGNENDLHFETIRNWFKEVNNLEIYYSCKYQSKCD